MNGMTEQASVEARELLAGVRDRLDEALQRSPVSRSAVLSAYAELHRATAAIDKALSRTAPDGGRAMALEEAARVADAERDGIDGNDPANAFESGRWSASYSIAAAERAAIVAWLRDLSASDTMIHHYARAATFIERGDHLSRRGEEGGK